MLKRLLTLFLCSLLLTLTSCTIETPAENELVYTFFDLDGAEAAVLQCGEMSALIDCGVSASFFELSAELDRRGIRSLDYFILTHPHKDHIGCADEVLRHYKPQTVIYPPLPKGRSDFSHIQNLAAALGSKNKIVRGGDSIRFGCASIDVFAPNSLTAPEVNNLSLVLKVTYESRSLLLCGDAEAQSEYEMLNLGLPLSADVLKIAHHGSKTSSTEAFLEAVNATYAILSVENDVSVLTEYRLQKSNTSLYRTDRQGTITVKTDGTNLTISSEK